MSATQSSIFETIFKQSLSPTVILEADAPKFSFVAHNKQYGIALDLADQDLTGKASQDFFLPDPANKAAKANYQLLVKAFNECISSLKIITLPPFEAQGVTRQVEVEPVVNESGQVKFLICTTHDISRMVQLEHEQQFGLQREQVLSEEVAASNDELRASNEELSASNEELRQSQESLFESNQELEYRVEERTRALSESEARFRTMVEQSPVPMLVTKGKAIIFEVINRPMLELTGKDESVIGMPWDEAMPELKGQEIIDQFMTTFESGKAWQGNEIPIVIYKNQGPALGFYNISYKPLIEKGETIGMLLSAIDVTELVKARLHVEEINHEQVTLNEELTASNEELAATNDELAATNEALIDIQDQLTVESAERKFALERLQANEENIRNMVLQAPVGMCIVQGDPLWVVEINDSFLEIIGKTREALKMNSYWEVIAEAAEYYQPIANSVLACGETYRAKEHQIMLIRQGKEETVYVDFVYEPMKDTEGKPYAIMIVAIDVTDKVLARKKIQQAEEELRMATESGELATWYLNEKLGIINASARFNEIFGFNLDEKVPFSVAIEQIRPDYQQIVKDAVAASFKTGARFNVEFPISGFQDNKDRWVRSVGKMVADDKNGAYITGVMADITEQKLDDIRKNDFIGMVSHELKTPLTSLNAYLQALEVKTSKTAEPFVVNALSQSLKQIKKMTAMINGFLNVSRLESGKINIDKQHFDMADVVKESEAEVVLMNGTHTFIFHPVEPTPVFADKDKISQVINNLISNAIKYSKPGTTIQIACVTENEHAMVSVHDEGMGISPEHLSHLFQRYYRVESNSHIAGFGIGLYLSEEIISRHEGKLWATSELGKGSTFFFTIPVWLDQN